MANPITLHLMVRLLYPRLSFERGTIRIDNAKMLEIPNAKFDERSGTLRAYGMHYSGIMKYLNESGIACDDVVRRYEPMPSIESKITLRDYQSDAISRWQAAQMRGCVILPTGSGKTAVGLRAICVADVPALVMVPTIDLLNQWTVFLQQSILVEGYETQNNGKNSGSGPFEVVGRLGGGYDDIRPITVATYDSAYLRISEIGDMFGILVFDEVHHLPAVGYRSIAEQSVAPFRLGLSATFEREDGLHAEIPRLAGGVVYRRGAQDLAEKKHLAKHDVRRIRVKLTASERHEYDQSRSEFLAALNSLGMRSESMYNLKRLILMSNRNKTARTALLARNRASEIAFNTTAKMAELHKILAIHCSPDSTKIKEKDDEVGAGLVGMYVPGANTDAADTTTNVSTSRKKTIIFTQNNKMAYRISDAFLIPIITHKTSKAERKEILDGFRSELYVAVVTSRVLDEGIDVPDAELGIVVSGTGSGREMVQRLGRLLRPKQDGRRALLIEMISDDTRETGSSARRSAALRRSSAGGAKKGRTRKQQRPPTRTFKDDGTSHSDENIDNGNGENDTRQKRQRRPES